MCSIVSTIQDRGYVEQQERRFVPTWLGETVNELMLKHFPEIVDTNFTADMERRLDAVEEGKQGWTEFLKDFYTALREQLERAEAEMDRVQKPVEEANEACPTVRQAPADSQRAIRPLHLVLGLSRLRLQEAARGEDGRALPEGWRRSGGATRASVPARCSMAARTTRPATSSLWDRPLTTPCPECGGLLTLANGKTEAALWRVWRAGRWRPGGYAGGGWPPRPRSGAPTPRG